jgi:MFS transporter, DHA1 family, multidrug resistance protein
LRSLPTSRGWIGGSRITSHSDIALHGPRPEHSTGGGAHMTSRRLLALLIAMTAIGPLSLNILVPAVPGLAATLDTDPAYVQLTISLYLFGLASSQLALGPLSEVVPVV